MLTIIIVTWNSENEISGCLSSLTHSLKNINHEIIVVDNNSSDKTVVIIKKEFPNVLLIKKNRNMGFGRGNNIALKKAKGERILLLNPDTIVNKIAILKMLTFLNTHDKAGAVGPEQRNESGRILLTISRRSIRNTMEYLWLLVYWKLFGKIITVNPKPREVKYLNAGCVMAKSHILQDKQWFHPDYHMYSEEFYLFPRIKKRGWKIFFMPDCFIYHFRDRSINKSGKRFEYATKSFTKFFVYRFLSLLHKPISHNRKSNGRSN